MMREGRMWPAVAVLFAFACESPYARRDPADVDAGLQPFASESVANATPVEPVSGPDVVQNPVVREQSGAFVVWESNRTNAWRLWTRPLSDGVAQQLTEDEDGRHHCCAHVSPDGTWIAYLSLPDGQENYPASGARGPLRLLRPDGTGERVLAPVAFTYSEHRAVVWHAPDTLVYIDADRRTRQLALDGTSSVLAEAPTEDEDHGWLVNRTRTHATSGRPAFALYEDGRVVPQRILGGCQPYFSFDGRWGYWTAGPGGPIRAMDLGSREIHTVLDKSDRSLPADQGYVYFPMLSSNQRLLAFAASRDEHSHHTADYDVFVVETDPKTLAVLSRAQRITEHPSTDRFPDVWAPSRDGRLLDAAPVQTLEKEDVEGWPVRRSDLVLLWERDGGQNRSGGGRLTGDTRFAVLTSHGRAFYDRHGALDLRGGHASFDMTSMTGLLEGSQKTNEMTLEALVTSAGMDGDVVAFAGRRDRNFALTVEDGELVFYLRTHSRPPNGERVVLGRLTVGETSHVVVTYTPGRLMAYVDGERVRETDSVQSGFFHWKERTLRLGAWHGGVEGVAVYNRVLDAGDVAESYRLAGKRLARRKAVDVRELWARLVRKARIPTLADISPYDDALAVFVYEADGEKLRVVHHVLADGERLPVADRRTGTFYDLRLEPFAEQPQLESLVLSEVEGAEGVLYFDPSITAGTPTP